MLTNEQRAHDLTIALLPIVYNARVSEIADKARKSGHPVPPEEATINFFDMYMTAYKDALDGFNREFPSDK